jgi:hypothetical protein
MSLTRLSVAAALLPATQYHMRTTFCAVHPCLFVQLTSSLAHKCAVLTSSFVAAICIIIYCIVCVLQGLDLIYVDPVRRLLSAPLQSLGVRVLDLEQYAPLMSYLPWEAQRAVAQELLQSVLASGTSLRYLN